MRPFRIIRTALSFCLLLLVSSTGWAASTEVFVDQGSDAFYEGVFEDTVLDAFGVVRPGLGLQRFGYDGVEGFSALYVDDGGDVYVGSASDGLILRFAKGRFYEVYRTDPEKNAKDERVTALAKTSDGLWASFAPSGALLRIDGDGNAVKVGGLENAYVWKIEPSPNGGVVIATGLPGGVHHVDAQGKVRKGVHEIDALHVMDFLEVDGDLWVATAMPARVIRLEDHKKQRVLFELGSADEALALLAAPSGGAFVLTNKGAPTAKASSKKSESKSDKSDKAVGHAKSAVDAFGPSTPAPKSPKPLKGAALWHVDSRAAPRLIRALGTETALAVGGISKTALAKRVGGVVVGMSAKGRALSLNPEGYASVLFDTAEASIEAMQLSERGEGYVITAGGAALYRVTAKPGKAIYMSPVRDASVAVRVGRVDLVGDGVRVEVRTGTTATPLQGAWSPWAPVAASGSVPRISDGRFVQYRAVFSTAASSLRAVRVAYRAPNRAPVVQSVEFVDRKSKVSTPDRPLRGKKEKGLRKAKKVFSSVKAKRYTGIKRIGFNVQDEDGDDLRFEVRARQVGTSHWTRLTPEAGVEAPFVDWVVADYPDGRYEVEVVSSDSDTNPPGEGLSSRSVSQPVLVDNHPPEISSARVRLGKLEFSVRDASSPLKRVEVAVDGGPWRTLAPVDGILDGKDERFVVGLKALGANAPALLRIGVEDSFGHRSVEGVNVP